MSSAEKFSQLAPLSKKLRRDRFAVPPPLNMPMAAFASATPLLAASSTAVRPPTTPLRRRKPLASAAAAPPAATTTAEEPLLIRAARGQPVPRPPVWLMRQAGRYMAAFRAFSDTHPFRERSESPAIATELSLQPYRTFGTDAVIMFSDILTPLPALGIDFDVVSGTGPVIPHPIRTEAHVDALEGAAFNPAASLPFVADVLRTLRAELAPDPDVALLGFVGAPFTLAAYIIEGRATKNITHVKHLMYGDNPSRLHRVLQRLTDAIANYCIFQLDAGAQAVQLFDSWAHHLSPTQYATFALPYAAAVIDKVKAARPNAPLIFFANGSSGKLDDIARVMSHRADVIGIDWSVRMADARRILGNQVVLQGNVDPSVLAVGSEDSIREAVFETVDEARGGNLILNLGHGVIKETPERAVEVFVNEAKSVVTAHV